MDSIFIVLLGLGGAGYILWLAYQNPESALKALPVEDALPVAVDPAAVQKELEIVKKQFQTPVDYEKRLAAQHLTEESLRRRIAEALAEESRYELRQHPVTEEQLRQWYEQNREKLRIPECFHAAHVFLSRHGKDKGDREAEIRAIQARITSSGSTFSSAAAQYSEDDRTKRIAGDLGWFTAERMPPDFMSAVRSLRAGQVSAPVQTGLGWHLIQLIEKRASRVPSFEECRAEIHAHLDTKSREAALR